MRKSANLTIYLLFFLAASAVTATPISIKLTTDALGLGSSDLNSGGTVDPDMPGFYTSSVIGQGSVLTVQTDGLAGSGTAANPLFATITSQTHLDTLYGLPGINDYLAGALYLTKENDKTPDGKDEGLGVRAFTVDDFGLRKLDSATGLALIEGSKHVSGGTGPEIYIPGGANGAPHVDEDVNFDFSSAFQVDGSSVEVLLSKYVSSNIVDLHIDMASGEAIDLPFLETTNTAIFERIGGSRDRLWKLKFSGISQLQAGDRIDSFTIRANDDNPSCPRGTAEHFFITGFTVDADVVPEPATVALLCCGVLMVARHRKGRSS